jgi:aerobic-type carbon monoxide dehydrogenase small subunit (CoxS/CutS family)
MTIKAIGETPSGRKIQIARLELDVVQCGYCQPGQVMSASALLDRDPNPTMPASMRLWSATYVAAVRISVYEP